MPSAKLPEIALAFLRLGCISFGGPVAHLGYFREEFVTRRQWLDDEAYGDLVALCQFLPGPASSQVVFALGMRRGGILGALLASLCFTLPSSILMILFAYGISALDPARSGWLHGLKLAAVAVVAQAVWGMGKSLCPDPSRRLIAIIVATAAILLAGPAAQAGLIALGGVAGWFPYRRSIPGGPPSPRGLTHHHAWAIAALILFLALLIVLPLASRGTAPTLLNQFDSFYRSGSLVFGGGHVVLPLLYAEVVPPGWISDNTFLAGYGAAQAVPGPLFTFSAFLGAAINHGPNAWLGGLWCLFAIFLPAWLLIGGALPFWDLLRADRSTRAALYGANAAVVGLLLAALYDPVCKQAITSPLDILIALIAFGLLQYARTPAWFVVLLAAAAGQWLL